MMARRDFPAILTVPPFTHYLMTCQRLDTPHDYHDKVVNLTSARYFNLAGQCDILAILCI